MEILARKIFSICLKKHGCGKTISVFGWSPFKKMESKYLPTAKKSVSMVISHRDSKLCVFLTYLSWSEDNTALSIRLVNLSDWKYWRFSSFELREVIVPNPYSYDSAVFELPSFAQLEVEVCHIWARLSNVSPVRHMRISQLITPIPYCNLPYLSSAMLNLTNKLQENIAKSTTTILALNLSS